MKSYYIDTHCHLDLFEKIQENVKKEDSYPIKTVTVTNAPDFFEPNNQLFAQCKNIRVGLGLHPELAQQFKDQVVHYPKYLDQTKYVGEVGLDGSARFKNTYSIQHEIFSKILRYLSVSDGKVITVHSRNAEREVIDLLNNYKSGLNNKIILHWYSGDKASLKRATDMGIYLSVNHKMLQSKNGIEILKSIPRHLLLTETDAPFTFGKGIKNRLESLELTHSIIAKTLQIEQQQVSEMIYDNFKTMVS